MTLLQDVDIMLNLWNTINAAAIHGGRSTGLWESVRILEYKNALLFGCAADRYNYGNIRVR